MPSKFTNYVQVIRKSPEHIFNAEKYIIEIYDEREEMLVANNTTN